MSLVGKRITQKTFDDVVRENIDDLELDPEEAIADAIEQFKAQGIELSNIVTDLVITDDGSSWHPVVNAARELKSGDFTNKESLYTKLESLRAELDKSLAHRVLANTEASCFLCLVDIYDRLDPSDHQSKLEVLKTVCSFLNGQPDCVYDRIMDIFIENSVSTVPEICLYGVRLVKLSCIMHETNRQAFIGKEIVKTLAQILTSHENNGEIVKEVCQAMRTLTLDDDPRVPFGKAHDHAKMIVTEANALELLLKVANEHSDQSVLGEIFATLGRLAVRNEFCQRIVDLGGLDKMLTVLRNNIDSRDISNKIIAVLKAIAGNDDVKVAVTKSMAPELIVEAMDRHQTSEAICANSCACLATVALRNPANVSVIFQANGHVAVIQCMKVHPSSTNVQKQACMAVRNLVARTRENCDKVLALGGEELINNAMQLEDVKDEAKAALRDLGCKVELTERWTGEKGSISH